MTSPVSAIEAIEKAMEGVTPGPWQHIQTGHGSRVKPDIAWCGHTSSQSHAETEANAAYIAACNPAAIREVLALARQAEALQRENAELRAFAASFKFTCVDVSFYKDCYLHINDPDSVSFRLNNGSQFSQFIAKLEDRRARALLGGENAE